MITFVNPTTKPMKILAALIAANLLSSPAFAEGDAGHINEGFLKTAKEYDAKAELANKAGNQHNAEIFRKLAAIKREAAVHQGNYDWGTYHELQGKLQHDALRDKKHAGNKDKNVATEINPAAARYMKLARKSRADGDMHSARIYARMAAIKRQAARSEGEFDWSEYHALQGKLNEKQTKADRPATDKKPSKSAQFIKDAQSHAALANQASTDGDSASSQIHTRLSAILIDAAAREDNGDAIDWEEFTQLKEKLKK